MNFSRQCSCEGWVSVDEIGFCWTDFSAGMRVKNLRFLESATISGKVGRREKVAIRSDPARLFAAS